MAVIARSASASVEKLRREAIFQATLNAIATKNEIIQSPTAAASAEAPATGKKLGTRREPIDAKMMMVLV